MNFVNKQLLFKGVLIVIDAEKMVELGRAYVPISIPFGFHNRYAVFPSVFFVRKKHLKISDFSPRKILVSRKDSRLVKVNTDQLRKRFPTSK